MRSAESYAQEVLDKLGFFVIGCDHEIGIGKPLNGDTQGRFGSLPGGSIMIVGPATLEDSWAQADILGIPKLPRNHGFNLYRCVAE